MDYLLMSLTYMAMDFCIWYYDLLQSTDGLPTWKEREVVTGTVTRNRSKFYCGSAEIQTLRDGDEIGIRRRARMVIHIQFTTKRPKISNCVHTADAIQLESV